MNKSNKKITPSNKLTLIVEDNVVNQRVTSLIVEQLGYPVTSANNGQKAVMLCEKTDYDYILMDISMPKMDGFEAIKKIRKAEKRGSRAKIVIVTGNDIREYRERFDKLGVDDFLTKPVDLSKLKKALDYNTKNIES